MVDKIWYNMEELIGGSEERGINRNILECKAASERRRRFDYVVLIETYWNVKLRILYGMTVFRIVLIETYWNVKKVKPKILLSFDMVLIETYWNVKL
jgi:hypothetical protein